MASIPLPIPGMPGFGLPGLDFGSGPAVSSAAGGMQNTPIVTPFVFDNSGWNVNIKGSATQDARGSSGAAADAGGNPSFSGSPTAGGPFDGGTNQGLPGMLMMLLGAWMLLG